MPIKGVMIIPCVECVVRLLIHVWVGVGSFWVCIRLKSCQPISLSLYLLYYDIHYTVCLVHRCLIENIDDSGMMTAQ